MELENIIYPGFNKTLSELKALSKVKNKSCEIVDLTEIEWVRDVLRHRVEEIGSYDIKFRKPTEQEIELKLAELKYQEEVNAYKEKRKLEYPDWGDQLDQIYHSGIDVWKSDIKVIKELFLS